MQTAHLQVLECRALRLGNVEQRDDDAREQLNAVAFVNVGRKPDDGPHASGGMRVLCGRERLVLPRLPKTPGIRAVQRVALVSIARHRGVGEAPWPQADVLETLYFTVLSLWEGGCAGNSLERPWKTIVKPDATPEAHQKTRCCAAPEAHLKAGCCS